MTPEPIEQILEPAIDEARIASNWQQIRLSRGPRRRSAIPRWSFAVATAAIAVVVAYLAWPSRGGPLAATDGRLAVSSGAVLDAPRVAFDDGSSVALDAGTHLQVLTNDADRFVTLLERGRAHFDVEPGGPRRWEIETPRATVEVVGTAFRVEATEQHVVVEVDRGVVVVRGERVPGRAMRLVAGQRVELADRDVKTAKTDGDASRTGPDDGGAASRAADGAADRSAASRDGTADGSAASRAAASATVASSEHDRSAIDASRAATSRVETAAASRAAGDARASGASRPGDASRASATHPSTSRTGDASRTADADHAHTSPRPPTKLATALADADQLRAAGNARAAAALLEQALQTSRADESAGLVEFTLGRIYLEDLGAPDKAAAAFARIIALGTPRGLLEDAYARRIESLARAGRDAAAHAALDDYDRLYPHGVRRQALHALVK